MAGNNGRGRNDRGDGNGGGGGLGGPGQRVIIPSSVREEIGRILKTVFWMTVFSTGIIGLTFFDAVMWGPMAGVIVGAVGIAALWRYRVLPATARGANPHAHGAALFSLLVALVVWGSAGYALLAQVWPPYRLGWPLWTKVTWEVTSLVLRAILGFGAWGMWSELVDPNGPTPPREAVARDRTIKPWDPETFGGRANQVQEVTQQVVYLPTIIDEMRDTPSGRKHFQDRVLLRAPGARPDGLYQYCAALAAGRAFPSYEGGRTGPGAQQYGYSPVEFEDWRAAAEKAGLLVPKGRNQGYEPTERGLFQFERIGERGLQSAAFSAGKG